MQYLLVLHVNESGWGQLTPEQQQQGTAAYMAYGEALRKAGAFLGSNRLKPSSNSTTVRVNNGKTQVLDGPYADTKEQVGGYILFDVPSMDEAIRLAAEIPVVRYGGAEIRPVYEMKT